MRRFGLTTVRQWLYGEKPEGVTAYYVNSSGLLRRIVWRYFLRGDVVVRVLDPPHGVVHYHLSLADPDDLAKRIVLSRGEDLNGRRFDDVASDLVEAEAGCWALSGQPRPEASLID